MTASVPCRSSETGLLTEVRRGARLRRRCCLWALLPPSGCSRTLQLLSLWNGCHEMCSLCQEC